MDHLVGNHRADLLRAARQHDLARAARAAGPRTRPVRAATARLLVAVAGRLDRGVQPRRENLASIARASSACAGAHMTS
jgi:hypothetical protein